MDRELKKGDFVLCDSCDTPIYKLTRDASFGDNVDVSLLRPLLPQPKPKDGEFAICKHCGGGVHFNRFKTQKGEIINFDAMEILNDLF